VVPVSPDIHSVPFVLAYIGPDQIMPLTSAIGAIVGLALMFWNRLVGLVHKCWTYVSGRGAASENASAE
jgi:hypothetical protein